MKQLDHAISEKEKAFSFLSLLAGMFIISFLYCIHRVNAAPIHIVAAENMYGNIAQQIGGSNVKVEVILNNPDQDPHLFELTPYFSQIVDQADLVIMNGLGYDDWIKKLINHNNLKSRKIVSIQELLNRPEGSNPHLWYDLRSVELLATKLVQTLSDLKPDQRKIFLQNKEQFLDKIKQIKQRITHIRSRYPHITIAATEPVFGLMAKNMGFTVLEEPYQWVIMNGGEPTPQQIAQFIQDLKSHKIQILIYNNQVSNNATENLKKIALRYKIPVVGVEEIMPVSSSYQKWINQTLDKLEIALRDIP